MQMSDASGKLVIYQALFENEPGSRSIWPGEYTTGISSRFKRSSSRERCGACRTRLSARSRTWSRFHSTKQRLYSQVFCNQLRLFSHPKKASCGSLFARRSLNAYGSGFVETPIGDSMSCAGASFWRGGRRWPALCITVVSALSHDSSRRIAWCMGFKSVHQVTANQTVALPAWI